MMNVSPRIVSGRRGGVVAPICAALAAIVICAASCARDSYVVVRLKAPAGTGTLTGVSSVVVTITDAATSSLMATRTFTVASDAGVAIDTATGKSFSVSFTPERSGMVDVSVQVFHGTECVASGSQTGITINKGGVTSTIITLGMSGGCSTGDGGVPDGKVTFTGCDPAVVGSCPGTETCYVDCTNQIGVCVAGGTRRPGEACGDNNDCAPGSQCFDFGCGPGTKYCLKFCSTDTDCAGSTSVSATSNCSDPVVCPPETTYRTCGFVCDPRGAATSGCPAGLACFLFKNPSGGQDTPACNCTAPTRIGVDGTPCSFAEACAPGFLCDQMAGGAFCRRICQMGSPGDCPTTQTCTALNNLTFGVCLGT